MKLPCSWLGLLLVMSLTGVSSVLAASLHSAAQKGDHDQVEQLIAQGADVNATTQEGLTPLHVAATEGHLAVVELLIANGAQVNAKDEAGNTPLHAAAKGGNLAVVEQLITQGADSNVTNNKGIPPLYWAAIQGHLTVVERLIASGANVSTVEQLIRRSADPAGHAEDRSTSQPATVPEAPRTSDVSQQGEASPTPPQTAVPRQPLPATAAPEQQAVIKSRLQWETATVSYQYPAEEPFTLSLPKLVSLPEKLPRTVTLDASGNPPSWIQFDPQTLQISGTAPITAVNRSFRLTFRARAEGGIESPLQFHLTIVKPLASLATPRQPVSEPGSRKRPQEEDCLLHILKGKPCAPEPVAPPQPPSPPQSQGEDCLLNTLKGKPCGNN